MGEYLVDTDIFVDHLRGTHEIRPREKDRLAYSVITRAELYAGRADAEVEVARLLDGLVELPVTRWTAETAGRIRRTTGVSLRCERGGTVSTRCMTASTACTKARAISC